MKAPSSALLLRATVVAATWLILSASAQVPAPLQTQAADSRITQVKVYPGSATVERVALPG